MTQPRRWHCTAAFVNTLKDISRNIGTTAPVAALLALPVLFASLAQWRILGTGRIDLEWVLITVPLVVIGAFTTGIWLNASILYGTAEFAKGGDPGIRNLLARGFVRIPSLLGTYLLLFAIQFVAFMIAATPALGVWFIGGGPARFKFTGALAALMVLSILLGILILIGALFIIYFRFAMAPAASVLEEKSPLRSLGRSRQLMRGRWFDYFLLALILTGVGFVLSIVFAGPIWMVSFGNLFSGPTLGGVVILAISTYLIQALNPLLVTGATANYYLALRGDEAVAAALEVASGASGNDEPNAGENQKAAGQDSETGNLPE